MSPASTSSESFRAMVVTRGDHGPEELRSEWVTWDQLPPGDTLVRVSWSSLNYKDALAARAHPGVAKQLPHVPGIDAAGTVVECSSGRFRPGQQVIVTGYELGAGRWGGWADYIRVPSEWVVPLPNGLTMKQAMILGTAGFTAAQAVGHLRRSEVQPSDGSIVVTGASGGVGCIAVQLLSALDYEVTAVTGKPDVDRWLCDLGAAHVIDRSAFVTDSEKPLLPGKWAGAVDTVGGDMLKQLLCETRDHGCVAACGMVGGTSLSMTVFPFILRGISLAGITSSNCRAAQRRQIWQLLSDQWRLDDFERFSRTVQMEDLPVVVKRILDGQIRGRVVIQIDSAEPSE